MMWKEFEELAGYEVSFEDYTNVIEPMYMATNLNKREFIACLDEKRFSLTLKRKELKKSLIKQMKEKAEEIKELCGHRDTYPEYAELRALAKQYIEEFPEWRAPHHEFETAKGYAYCTYITALVYYDEDWNEVSRVKLVAA